MSAHFWSVSRLVRRYDIVSHDGSSWYCESQDSPIAPLGYRSWHPRHPPHCHEQKKKKKRQVEGAKAQDHLEQGSGEMECEFWRFKKSTTLSAGLLASDGGFTNKDFVERNQLLFNCNMLFQIQLDFAGFLLSSVVSYLSSRIVEEKIASLRHWMLMWPSQLPTPYRMDQKSLVVILKCRKKIFGMSPSRPCFAFPKHFGLMSYTGV